MFAVDTNPLFLEFIKNRAEERGLVNIEMILATRESVTLSGKNLRLIFMRNVCHHLQKRVEYFRKLKEALGTNGRIAIIEYRGVKGFSFHRFFGHYVPKEKIIREMKEAGFQLVNDLDFLPEQSFTIYSLEKDFGAANSTKHY